MDLANGYLPKESRKNKLDDLVAANGTSKVLWLVILIVSPNPGISANNSLRPFLGPFKCTLS